MKDNNLLQKISLVMLTFMLLIALFCTTAFAGEVTLQVSETETTTVNFNDNISCYEYILILYKDITCPVNDYYHWYEIYLSDKPIIYETNFNYEGTIYDYIIYSNTDNIYRRIGKVVSNEKNKDFENVLKPTFETLDISQFIKNNFVGTSSAFTSADIYASTHDITDAEGNLVFQGAPQIPEITATLVEQATQTQIQEQMKMTILGFLKYLIALVISVIAFWKGWKFLSKQFKTA